jgi:hypothetical protein
VPHPSRRLVQMALLCAAPLAGAAVSAPPVDDASNALARDIFRELIEINTTDSVGSVTQASEAMAKRLRDAGFPAADVEVLGPNDRKKNLVVRLRGTGKHRSFSDAHHLRCHALEWRPCEQCAATAGAGQRELPHPARPFTRRSTAGDHKGARKPEDHCASHCR